MNKSKTKDNSSKFITLTEFVDICKSYGLVETCRFEWCCGMSLTAEPNVSFARYYNLNSSEPLVKICYPLFIDQDALKILFTRTIEVNTTDELKKMVGRLVSDYKKLTKQIRMQWVDKL